MTNNKDENINGFNKIKEFGNVAFLENNYDVALGRFYTRCISEKTFEEENFNVDNLLADAVILEKNSEFEVSHADLVAYRNPQSDERLLKSFQDLPLAQFKVVGNDGHLVRDFEAPRDGLLLLTIPYEGGWHAYVDGKRVIS